jgi:hypothetical protein
MRLQDGGLPQCEDVPCDGLLLELLGAGPVGQEVEDGSKTCLTAVPDAWLGYSGP